MKILMTRFQMETRFKVEVYSTASVTTVTLCQVAYTAVLLYCPTYTTNSLVP